MKLFTFMDSCSCPCDWQDWGDRFFFLRFPFPVSFLEKVGFSVSLLLSVKTCVQKKFLHMLWFSIHLLIPHFYLSFQRHFSDTNKAFFKNIFSTCILCFLAFCLLLLWIFLPHAFLPFAFFPFRTPSPKTIITSLVIQLADRLIRQKKLNPTAQHRQIILFAKPASPLLEQCFHLHQSDHKHSAGKS